MKFRSFIIALFTVLSLAVVVTASSVGFDDEGTPNDPALNDRANACFEGGTLEGRCETVDIDKNGTVDDWEIEWHYVCGWYLIRIENDLIDESNLPNGCQMPIDVPYTGSVETIETEASESPTVCPGTDLLPPCPTT